MIVTPKWMFVATITGPYTKHNDVPVYVDAYAYCGILNVQTTMKVWPATAGLQDDELSPYEILERSSQLYRPEHEQILGPKVTITFTNTNSNNVPNITNNNINITNASN